MSKTSDASNAAAERLMPFVEDAARTHYGGVLWKGFKFWAMSEILIASEISDDDLKTALDIDGRSDLGLDGYIEDIEEETLILVQSRFHEAPKGLGNGLLADFRHGMPTKLRDPDVVAAANNPRVADAHRAFLDAVENGWRIRFVVLWGGWLTPEGRKYLEANASGQLGHAPADLEVFDWAGLDELYGQHLVSTTTSTDVELDIAGAAFHDVVSGGFRVLVATIPAAEIVKAFDRHAHALFRLNPRGPLKNRTNQRIYQTLTDPNRRKTFFLLNNGLTALCESWKLNADKTSITVRNFQIVNGCQTTVTLAKARPIVMANRDICVGLRLIEGVGHMSTEIAESTNTQTRLTAEDFKSNDGLQRDLKQQFASLPAPWFYEIKRGEWDTAARDKTAVARFAEGRVYRRVKMRDLAQATLAMLGEPGRAKDQIRVVFEQPEWYRKVFPDGLRAQQLLLPLILYREADELCAEWDRPYAPYARFAIVALVGRKVASGGKLPNLRESAAWLDRVEERALLLERAKTAIGTYIAVLGKDFPGPREFFRSEDRFKGLSEAFDALGDG